MSIVALFVGMVVGPIIGHFCAIRARESHPTSVSKAKMQAGVCGWFVAAFQGAVASGLIHFILAGDAYHCFSILGIQVLSLLLSAWVSATLAAAVGILCVHFCND